MTIYGYARTSSIDQQYGLSDQQTKLEAAGCSAIYSEQVSAKAMEDRTQWAKLVASLVSGDTVVVTTLSRLARSMKDTADIVDMLKAKSVGLNILDMKIDTSTAGGAMMFNVLAAFNTYEADIMKERQAVGIALAKEKDKLLPLSERTYQGRKPTARNKAGAVRALIADGMSKEQVAKDLGIGIASVYRILKTA
jgi:DNA invertase Pin-like site-specific DNA recombinase